MMQRTRCSHRAAWFVSALLVLLVAACGGGSSPSPTTPTPPAPTNSTNSWSLSGTIVDTVTRAAVAGAVVKPSWDLAPVTAASDGTYSLGAVRNPPTGPYDLTVSADGFIPRRLWVNWQTGARADVTLDLIRDAAPFSRDFYDQLARGTFDQEDAPWPVLRLVSQPTFFVRTVDQNGRAIEPEVVSVILDGIRRAVPAYTGGRYSAAIVTGTESRAEEAGWINVNIVRDPDEHQACGLAYVGRTAGEITLYDDACSCGSIKVPGHVVMHEVGHALGFFHVSDLKSVMYPTLPGRCPAGEPSRNELYHSAIAYSRPRGNTQPDDDPSTGPLSTSAVVGPGIRVRN